MSCKICYVTPFPPFPNGVADYAGHFKRAMERFSDWRLDVADPTRSMLACNSLRDLLRVRARVKRWRESGVLNDAHLVHAEIGYKQHEEFYTLYWLRRLMPRMPYSLTVHDSPLVVAPALYPLSMGTRSAAVRRALRVGDYTGLGKRIVRNTLSGASAVMVLTCAGKAALQAAFPCLPEPHALPFLTYREERPAPARRARGEPVRILFFGFWSAGKGIEPLLEAFENVVQERGAAIRLILAGGAERSRDSQAYARRVRQMVESSSARASIEILGYVPDEAIDRTFDAADIFVVPTVRVAGLSASSVLSRAMASGVGIIASAVGALPEELRDGETGLLVPPGDPAALADSIRRLAAGSELRAELGRRAQEHAYAEHGPEQVARRAASIFEAAASSRRR